MIITEQHRQTGFATNSARTAVMSRVRAVWSMSMVTGSSSSMDDKECILSIEDLLASARVT